MAFFWHSIARTSYLLPEGQSVLSGSCDGSMRVWDAATGALQRTILGKDASHTKLQPIGRGGQLAVVVSCSFSPDGSTVLGSFDHSVMKVWGQR